MAGGVVVEGAGSGGVVVLDCGVVAGGGAGAVVGCGGRGSQPAARTSSDSAHRCSKPVREVWC